MGLVQVSNARTPVDPSVEDGLAARRALGVRLQQIRLRAGYNQAIVARHLGIPRNSISRLESGIRFLDAVELIGLSELYQLSVTELLGLSSDFAGMSPSLRTIASIASQLPTSDLKKLESYAAVLLGQDPLLDHR